MSVDDEVAKPLALYAVVRRVDGCGEMRAGDGSDGEEEEKLSQRSRPL